MTLDMAKSSPRHEKGSRRGTIAKRESRSALLFLTPALVLLIAFQLIPTSLAVYLAFTRWDGFTPPQPVGLENFTTLVQDQVFFTALKHNLLLLLVIPATVGLSFVTAMLLSERPPGWRVFRACFFMPAVLSPVVVGSFFSVMLTEHGPLNEGLRHLGLGFLAHAWLADTNTALWALMAVNVWGQFGIGVLLYLAGMASIDPELYEAGRLDGASWWQTHRLISLPLLAPVTRFWAILVTIAVFTSQFALVLTLTNGGPGNATLVLEYYIYRAAFTSGELGYASAVGLVLLCLVVVTILVERAMFRIGRWW